MAKKRRQKLNQNRFQKKDAKGLFSFDPIRRRAFVGGIGAGGLGGLCMLIPGLFWQIAGVCAVVFISNYYINKASAKIPRWHATVISFFGVLVAMFGVIIIGTVVLTFLQVGSTGG